MKRYQIVHRASQSMQILEDAWEKLRETIDGLPPVVMVIMAPPRRWTLGHFRASSWKYRKAQKIHEVAISPDLFETHEDLLETLVHEAAHALLYENSSNNKKHIAGHGRSGYGRYHRKEFRDTARRFGLICEFNGTQHGWNLTRWPDNKVPKRYRHIVEFLKKSMPWGTGVQRKRQFDGKDTPQSGHVKLVCECKLPRNIYVKRSLVKDGGIICKFCNAEFHLEFQPK